MEYMSNKLKNCTGIIGPATEKGITKQNQPRSLKKELNLFLTTFHAWRVSYCATELFCLEQRKFLLPFIYCVMTQ